MELVGCAAVQHNFRHFYADGNGWNLPLICLLIIDAKSLNFKYVNRDRYWAQSYHVACYHFFYSFYTFLMIKNRLTVHGRLAYSD